MEPREKDHVLYELSTVANVAQFVSFGPGHQPIQRYRRIRGIDARTHPNSIADSIKAIILQSPEHRVNVRTFKPGLTKGSEFRYGIQSATEAEEFVLNRAREGLFTIVNETVDINDGGVSGVAFGEAIEFAPGDTPRCVEKPGTCRLPRELAGSILNSVYGFAPDLPEDPRARIEFSIHPLRRGHLNSHTIIWESELSRSYPVSPVPFWPNRFSSFLGDKTFGLLIASNLGCHVPFSTVISRHVAPFSFGERTGTCEYWLRTAPMQQLPGKLPTYRGWSDPFEMVTALTQDESQQLASVLSQEGIEPHYSGAAACLDDGGFLVEGVIGSGVDFMLGKAAPETLPDTVQNDVIEQVEKLFSSIGPSRIEWVHDGKVAWVVQIHVGGISSDIDIIYPGEAAHWIDFRVGEGLDALRSLIKECSGESIGIRLMGDVGITSHFGDLVRQHEIPSILVRST